MHVRKKAMSVPNTNASNDVQPPQSHTFPTDIPQPGGRAFDPMWQFAIDGVGDGLWDWNIQTGQVFYSSGWKATLGYAGDDINNTLDAWKQLVHPQDLPGVLENLDRYLKGATPAYRSEHRIRCKDGSYRWILDRGKIIEWTADHQPLRAIGTHTDITEHKLAEAALRQSQDSLRRSEQILRASQEIGGIQNWIANFDDGTIEIGPNDDLLLGWLPGQHRLADLMVMVHPADLPGVEAATARSLATGENIDLEHRLVVNGELKWAAVKTRSLEGESNPRVRLGFTQDITSRRQAEELAAAQRDLARLASADLPDMQVWETCIRVAIRVSGLDCGGIYLLDEPRSFFELAYSVGLSDKFVQAFGLFGVETLSGQRIMSGQPAYLTTVELSAEEHHRAEGLHSLAVIPIQHKGLILGCLNFGSHTFTHIPTVSVLALDAIAAEIANILIYRSAGIALRESEEQYRSLIDSQEAAISTIDSSGIIHFINQNSVAPYGLTPEQVVGKNILELFPPAVGEWLVGQVRAVIASGQGQTAEYEYQSRSGQPSWQHISIQPVRNAAGQVHLAVVNSQDITARRRAEQKLRESELRFSMIFHASPMGIVLTRMSDGMIVDANAAFLQMFEYERDELIGRTTIDANLFCSQDDRSRLVAMLHQQGKIVGLEIQYRKRSGTLGDLIVSTEVITLAGEPYMLNMMFDTTERRLSEEARREIDERYRLLFETMEKGVVFQAADGQIIAANAAAQQILGLTLDQLQGRTSVDPRWRSIREDGSEFPGDTHPAMVALRSGQPVRNVTMGVYNPQDDYYRWIRVDAVPRFRPGEEQPFQVYATFDDITADKLARERIQKSQASLEMAQAVARLGSWELDPRTHQGLLWSREMFRLFRRDPARGVPAFTEFMEMVHPNDRQALLDAEKWAIESGEDISYDYRAFPEPGQIRYFKATIRAVKDEHGNLLMMTGTTMDITEIRQAEDDLRRTEQRFRALIENAPDGVVMVGLDGKFKYVSPSVERIFGYKPEDAVGAEPDSLTHPDDLPVVLAELGALIQDPTRTPTLHYRFRDSKGEWRWIESTFSNMLAEPSVEAIVINFHDITERKREEHFTQARLRLAGLANTALDMEQLMRTMLDEAEVLTGSTIGFFHFVDDNQNTITLQTWSTHTLQAMCTAEGKGQHYPVDDAGVWADGIRSGKPCIYNDYPHMSTRRPLPEGHAPVIRLISLPIKRDGLIVAALGVGNKTSDYTERDLEIVQRLAEEAFDIVLRKRAEQALRISQEKYRSLLESLDSVVVTLDYDGRFIYLNDTAAGQLGGRPDDFIGRTLYELRPQAEADDQMLRVHQVIAEDRGILYERIGGVSKRWNRTSIQPIHDETGRVVQALINSTDIHALKTAQQELQELNRTLEERVRQRTAEVQDLYDNAPSGYHSVDVDGRVVMMNQTELNWLGRTRDEVIGHPLAEFISPASVQAFWENFARFKQQGYFKDFEYEFQRKDGSVFPVLVNSTAIFDAQGNFSMSRSTTIDITATKKADEALRLANVEMERALRLKDEFLASMSHELRTPLTGILGLSEALQYNTYGQLTEKQRSVLANIENSGRHLLDLINDILDVSKIEAGKLELQMETCSLGDVCRASLQLVKGMAHKKRQNILFSMQPASIMVAGDGRRLKQILANLLSNALKYSPEGSNVGLEVKADLQQVRIIVWDEGIGIAPEDIQKLFQPFVQLDSSLSRAQTGTGLGLALVQRLVDLHGGSITVESVVGQGSRFTVRLPALPETAAVVPGIEGVPEFIHRALGIEDDPTDAEHLVRYLSLLGIDAVLHPSGTGALARAIETRPDVILLDVHLPDISGWEVLAQLKANETVRRIPVIITSVEENRQAASQLGASGYLVKHYGLADLMAAFSRLGSQPVSEAPAVVPVAVPDTAPAGLPIVAIVDDNEVNLLTLSDFLDGSGYQVVTATSGPDFLSMLSSVRPAVVLMDIQMPGMDGLETIRRLRAHIDRRLAAIPVIAVTALAMPGDRERCLAAGANDYVSKPVSLKDVVARISSLVS